MAEVTLVLALEATDVGRHDGSAKVGDLGSVTAGDLVQTASLAEPLEITALEGRIPYRDALRTEPADIVQNSVDDVGMRHQAIKSIAGVRNVAVVILLKGAEWLAELVDVKHPIWLNSDPGAMSQEIAQWIPKGRAGTLLIQPPIEK